jgi:hypothetical protein
VNSIQLVRDGDGLWAVLAMVWDNEREGGCGLPMADPIPPFLPSCGRMLHMGSQPTPLRRNLQL